jgi:hypothetical protein
MTFTILLSLILTFGGAQQPTGNFDEGTTVTNTVATSSTTTSTDTVKQSKKG